MDWDLDEVLDEQQKRADERKRATLALRRTEWLLDMRLGRAIARAREREVPQGVIAGKMKLSREQVRRLENAWRDAVEKGEVSDADLDT